MISTAVILVGNPTVNYSPAIHDDMRNLVGISRDLGNYDHSVSRYDLIGEVNHTTRISD